MKVAVFGCGPAGLLAAHAATERECEVNIYSKKVPSKIGGAQYLHCPIPGITGEDAEATLSYAKIGTEAGYQMKVYGQRALQTSWSAYEGEQPAWPMNDAYRRLVNLYWEQVVDTDLRPGTVEWFLEHYDLVLSSVPAPGLCTEEPYGASSLHQFDAQPVTLVPTECFNIENTILYSGRPQDSWYRISRIFGHEWCEYAGQHTNRIGMNVPKKAVFGLKPIYTDCDCHLLSSKFFRVGRFGKWSKRELVSDAYKDAVAIIEAHLDGPPEGYDILGGKRMTEGLYESAGEV